MSERLEDLEWVMDGEFQDEWYCAAVDPGKEHGSLRGFGNDEVTRACAALNYVRGMTTEEIEAATQAKFAVKSKSKELGDWSFKRHREEVESRS